MKRFRIYFMKFLLITSLCTFMEVLLSMDKDNELNNAQVLLLKGFPAGFRFMLDVEQFIDMIPYETCLNCIEENDYYEEDSIDSVVGRDDIKKVLPIIGEKTIKNLKDDSKRIIALFAYGEYLCDYDEKAPLYKQLFGDLLNNYISSNFSVSEEEKNHIIGEAIWSIEEASIINLRDSQPAINILDILETKKYFNFDEFIDRDYCPVSLPLAFNLLNKHNKSFFYKKMKPIMNLKSGLKYLIKLFEK